MQSILQLWLYVFGAILVQLGCLVRIGDLLTNSVQYCSCYFYQRVFNCLGELCGNPQWGSVPSIVQYWLLCDGKLFLLLGQLEWEPILCREPLQICSPGCHQRRHIVPEHAEWRQLHSNLQPWLFSVWT